MTTTSQDPTGPIAPATEGGPPPRTGLRLPAGTWRLDPRRTSITATVRAMFGLFAVKGSLVLLEGTVHADNDATRSTVHAVVDASSFSSGNASRDRDVVGPALLDAGAHPNLSFDSSAVSTDADGWRVTGIFGAHGATATADLRLCQVTVGGAVATFRADGFLDRYEFGVTAKRGMVGRRVGLSVDAVALPV
ncbi:MAG: YceI family protein [Acidimicrobiales bacterium]